jgi:nitric oxide reductase large subunit
MRTLVRAIGWALVVLALLVLGRDLWVWLQGAGGFRPISAGELWYTLDRASLNLMQALTQRFLWPPLWDPGMVTVLRWPAVLVFGVPGLAILLLVRRRRRPARLMGGR